MNHSKTLTFLFDTVCIGFLCLCQVACQSDSSTDDVAQGSNIDPNTPNESESSTAINTQQEQDVKNTQVQSEKTNNLDTNSPTSVSDVPVSLNITIPNTNPEQIAHPPGINATPSSSTSTPQPTANKFILELDVENRKGTARNFALVKITPGEQGMDLKNFFVTAYLPDNRVTIRGSTGKKRRGSTDKERKGGFVYQGILDECCLAAIFLTNVNCLGANDTSFSRGQKVEFRIRAEPDSTISPGESCMLTVTVEYRGQPPHEATQRVELVTPPPSPKNTSPRKG